MRVGAGHAMSDTPKPSGKCQRQFRRQAGIARIDPVRVPVRFVLQTQPIHAVVPGTKADCSLISDALT